MYMYICTYTVVPHTATIIGQLLTVHDNPTSIFTHVAKYMNGCRLWHLNTTEMQREMESWGEGGGGGGGGGG